MVVHYLFIRESIRCHVRYHPSLQKRRTPSEHRNMNTASAGAAVKSF